MIVYFAGCMASYREKDIAKNTIELLKKLDTEFTMLGKDEWCCGSVMLRSGNVRVAKQMIEHNVKAINELKADTVITSCAGCYRTMKQDFPKYVGELNFNVMHTPEYIMKYIENGKIRFKPLNDRKRITYHDPCHMGRHMNMYDPPRKILRAIEGIDLVEMARSMQNARCCGSGGGVSAGYKELSNQMADTRLADALEIKADIITSACPFCIYALKSAAQRANLQDRLEVLELLEIINKQIE